MKKNNSFLNGACAFYVESVIKFGGLNMGFTRAAFELLTELAAKYEFDEVTLWEEIHDYAQGRIEWTKFLFLHHGK